MKTVLMTVAMMMAATSLTTAQAQSYPQPLEAALAKTQKAREARYAFTLHYKVDGQAYTLNYDPTQSRDAGWTLVSQAVSSLSAEEKQAFDELKSDRTPDHTMLLPEDLYKTHIKAELLRGDGDVLTYRLHPKPGPAKDGEMIGEIQVDKARQVIVATRFYNARPFKPDAVVKLEQVSETAMFAPVPGVDVPVATRRVTTVSGSAMFQPFTQVEDMTLSQVRRVR
ncbi:MAG: hypothetical protein ACK41P_11070 [Asticcacaulis sp.]